MIRYVITASGVFSVFSLAAAVFLRVHLHESFVPTRKSSLDELTSVYPVVLLLLFRWLCMGRDEFVLG